MPPKTKKGRGKAANKKGQESTNAGSGKKIAIGILILDFLLVAGGIVLFVLYSSCSSPAASKDSLAGADSTSGPVAAPSSAHFSTVYPDEPADTEYRCGEQKATGLNYKPGLVTVKHMWPWFVVITIKDGTKYKQCSGVIVTPRHVLTARSCLSMKVEKSFKTEARIVYGGHNRELFGFFVELYHARLYPQASIPIILITIDREITMNKIGYATCFPSHRASITYPQGAGNGCFSIGNLGEKRLLTQIKVQLLSQKDCSRLYGEEKAKTGKAFCATKVTKGASYNENLCTVDRGGPLVCDGQGQWILYGVVEDNSHCETANLYAEISYALDWFCCLFSSVVECSAFRGSKWFQQRCRYTRY